MELGRRAFLQFAAGAVGGTLLSPIPWKLMDDSADLESELVVASIS